MHVIRRLKERYNLHLTREDIFSIQKAISLGEPILPFPSKGWKGTRSDNRNALVNIKGKIVPCGIAISNGYAALRTALPRLGESSYNAYEEIRQYGSLKLARRARPDWDLIKELSWVRKTVAKIVEAATTGDLDCALPLLLENLSTNFDIHLSAVDPGCESLIRAIAPMVARSDLDGLRFIKNELDAHITRAVATHPLSWDLTELPGRYQEDAPLPAIAEVRQK